MRDIEVALSQDRARIAVLTRGQDVRIVGTDGTVRAVDASDTIALALHGDELWAASASSLRVFGVADGDLRHEFAAGLPAGNHELVVVPPDSGKRAAVVTGRPAQWLELQAGSSFHIHEVATSGVVLDAVLPDGRLVVESLDHAIELQAADGTVSHRIALRPNEAVVACQVSDGRHPLVLVVRDEVSHTLCALNAEGQRLFELSIAAPKRLRISRRRQFAFALLSTNELIAIDLRYGRCLSRVQAPFPVADFDVSADASSFVIARAHDGGPQLAILTYRELFSPGGDAVLSRAFAGAAAEGTDAAPGPEIQRAEIAEPAPASPPLHSEPRQPVRVETRSPDWRARVHPAREEHRPDAARRPAPPPQRPPVAPVHTGVNASAPRAPLPSRVPIPNAPAPEVLATHVFALVERIRATLRLRRIERGAPGNATEAERGFRAADEHASFLEAQYAIPFVELCQSLALDQLDRQTLALAVAPYLDDTIRAEIRLFRGDPSRGHVDGGLAVELFCRTRIEAIANAHCFGPDMALVASGLLQIVPPHLPHRPSPLECELVPTERLLGILRGELVLVPPSLGRFRVSTIDDAAGVVDAADRAKLFDLAQAAHRTHPGCSILVAGPPGIGRSHAASALAAACGYRGLLEVDAVTLPRASRELTQTLGNLAREAVLAESALLLRQIERARFEAEQWSALEAAARRAPTLLLFCDTALKRQMGAVTVAFEIGRPAPNVRADAWAQDLHRVGLILPPEEVDTLARQYALGRDRIAATVALANALAANQGSQIGLAELDASARTQLQSELSQYAYRGNPRATLADLVLPEDTRTSIEELIHAVRVRPQVMARWGFEERLPRGRGICALFNGPSGTGKTLAATVVANELALPMFRINVGSIVDRYVGETEKNLSRLFEEAADHHAVLLFDEADSLFSKRVETRDATDRYSNMQINVLLTLIENHEGFVILTTNMKSGIDSAFLRRIAYKVTFYAPDEDERYQLWRTHIPDLVPLADDVDLHALAHQYNLSGGQIKNIVLRAATRAWDSPPITQQLFREAIVAEVQSGGGVIAAPTRQAAGE